MRAVTLGVLAFAACGGLSPDEAEAIAMANNTLVAIAGYEALSRDLQAADGRSSWANLEWDEIQDGWSFSGELSSDGPLWTGTMVFDGTLVGDDGLAEWAFDVDFDGVGFEGTTYDGAMAWLWSVDVHHEAAWTMTYATVGTITAIGEIEGTADFDYEATLDVDGASVSYELHGEVAGRDVDVSVSIP